jgi:Fe-Mn family superoxide dismutase
MLTHALPDLAYSFDALEPHIDALTMEIHHDRHHQTYITNYTKLLEGTDLLEKYMPEVLIHHLDEVSSEKRQGVINNLGGHINHSVFWTILSPQGGGIPEGQLLESIHTTFGSFENFQQEFAQKALTVFGSGWAWLVMAAD